MTPAQLATLKAAIAADVTLNAFPQNSDGAFEIADALNQEASPAFYVWRTSYTPQQMRAAMCVNLGTAQLDALTAGKRDALLWFIGDTLNPSDPAIISTIQDFCGSQNTLKASLVDGAKRKAKRVEKILATGTGALATPATPTFEGSVSYQDVMQARSS